MSSIQITDTRIKDFLRDCWNDRILFIKTVYKINPTDQQAEALRALDKACISDKDIDVSHRSGHGIGKSALMVWTKHHYMTCRPFPRIICSAPSKHQLYDVLWAESAKWLRIARDNSIGKVLFEPYKWTKENFFHIQYPGEWFARPLTATKEQSENLAGLHAEYILKLVDEASGVPDEIYDTLNGAHGTAETLMYMAGNPTRRRGEFYESFTNPKMRDFYITIKSSCIDSPIVRRQYIKKMLTKYGENSDMYRVRVLGEPPKKEGDGFIPFDWASNAIFRDITGWENEPEIWGVDVASGREGGDRSVLARRKGNKYLPYEIFRNENTMQLVNAIAERANKIKPKSINVDSIGLGDGVYRRLEQMGFPVLGINVTELPAYEPNKYHRLKDELWGKMRDALEGCNISFWDNDERDLLGELTMPKMLSDERTGKIRIEGKDTIVKRLKVSPDIAEAHVLTYASECSSYNSDEFDYFDNSSSHQVLDPEAGY